MTTVDASSTFSNGGATQDPYVGPSFTPPNGSTIYAAVWAFATSGDDNSEMGVSGGALTWTRVVGLDQLHNGGSVAPPPIAFFTATGTGVPIQLTQECIDGLGFAHVQCVWVLTDAGALLDTGTFTGLTAASITMTATAAGQLALFAMVDWGNSADVPVEADAAMTTRLALANADIQSSFGGDLFSSGAGPITVGTQLLANPQGTNAIAVLIDAASSGTIADAQVSVVAITPPAATAGVSSTPGAAAAAISAPAITATVAATPTPAPAAFTAPTATAVTVAQAGVAGIGVGANGVASSVAAGALVATVDVNAYNATGPSTITGMSTNFGPCEWPLIQCASWPTGSEAVTGNAVSAATEVLWQKTAQRYGLCDLTIRPCRQSCGDGWPWDSWWQWGGGMWPRPLLYNGMWFNITCGTCPGTCSCTALEQVELPGPVNEVTEVKINGVVLAPTSYRLDDNRMLVRTDGGRWPHCQDMSQPDTEDDTWSITIVLGEEVPIIGQQALGQLANMLARECVGEDCKLPKNIASLVRQGITVQLNDDWLRRLTFVDLFIGYANPNNLIGAPAIYDPDAQPYRRAGA